MEQLFLNSVLTNLPNEFDRAVNYLLENLPSVLELLKYSFPPNSD